MLHDIFSWRVNYVKYILVVMNLPSAEWRASVDTCFNTSIQASYFHHK